MRPRPARRPDRGPARTAATRVALCCAALLGVAVLVGAGLVVTRFVALSRAEVALSERIRPPGDGAPLPAVTLGGSPVARPEREGDADRYPSLAVRVEEVRRPVVGPVVVTVSATGVTVPDDPAAAPGIDSGTVSVLIGGDALGRALAVDGLLLANADDSSLAGGTELLARLTAPDGATGLVRLLADRSGARLEPVDPGSARFALRLPADLLPAGAAVDELVVRGGTLSATGRLPGPALDPRALAADAG